MLNFFNSILLMSQVLIDISIDWYFNIYTAVQISWSLHNTDGQYSG